MIAPPARPPASALPAPPAPVAPDERVELLDVLRGFALWGVCLANLVPWFSGYEGLAEPAKHALPTWPADRVTQAFLGALVHARFITIFSFLFGLGFAVQYLRAEARGAEAGRLLARRLAAMFAIGLAHRTLVWYGDILTVYATLGLVLLAARAWPVRRLLAVGVALVVLQPIAWSAFVKLAPVVSGGALSPAASNAHGMEVMTKQLPALVAQPGYGAVLAANRLMNVEVMLSPWSLPGWTPSVAGLFLLGLCVGRSGILRHLDGHRDRWWTAFRWAAAAAVVGYGPRLYIDLAGIDPKVLPLDVVGMIRVLRMVGQPATSLAFVCALVLLFQRPAWRRRLMALAPVGRMALTNYLAQSVLAVALFYGIGLGLHGRVGPTALVALSLLTIAAQAVASRWWLARYRFGPAEWLWRSLTYGRPQPMRLADGAGTPSPVPAA